MRNGLIYSVSFSSRWHRSAGKGPYTLRPVPQQSPQSCPRNSASICLVEHKSFSALEGGMSIASFLHSSFLQVINAVMLWPVHAEKVPQASEHLCPAKLQTRCDICCACQAICPFIPTDSGVPRTVDPQKSLFYRCELVDWVYVECWRGFEKCGLGDVMEMRMKQGRM